MRKLIGILATASLVVWSMSCGSDTPDSKTEPLVNKLGKETTDVVNGVSIDMISIPGGTFTMGSPTTEVERSGNETQHRVTLSAFKLGKYEVTQGLWKAVMSGSNPSEFKGDNLPVEGVSWNDVQLFLTELNLLTGKTYSLPTEAQWEYACRAGTTTPFNTGSCLNNNQANYNWRYAYGSCTNTNTTSPSKTQSVGSYAPNGYGLYDMHGNVWEWCSDWYGDYPTGTQTNPVDPTSGRSRVYRGGSWTHLVQGCRSAHRDGSGPDGRDSYIGLRLALCSDSETEPPVTEPDKETADEIEGMIGMVDIPGGTFTMGSPTTEVGRFENETQHQVTLSAFKMGKYEVTQGLWKAVMGGANPSEFKGDDLPVNVSWNDVQTFLIKLNLLTGKTYSLPTEAQWEYACRAGTTTPFNTGSCLTDSQANYIWAYPYGTCTNTNTTSPGNTQSVGSYAPNSYGLYDMHGNVLEWCRDWYGIYPTGAQTNPEGPTSGSDRVTRGGNWDYVARFCRSAHRSHAPDYRYYIGFRLALCP